jgi:bifunctional non-homologous end joining protein LigD
MEDPLKKYRSKRDFTITPEPSGGGDEGGDQLKFVIQKHWATRLHYDFRLELGGAMKSWAVPKGPSYDPHDKRMAVHVEDHPISYNSFEGTIPAKQYGAGKVIIWDEGSWHPIGDPEQGYKAGNLKFELRGHKMHGKWALIKIKNPNSKQEAWLLIKEKDEFVRPSTEFSVVDEMPDSVKGLSKTASAAQGAKPKRKTNKAAADIAVPDDEPARPASSAARSTTAAEPAAAPATRKAALPATFAPQLATLVDAPPSNPDEWSYEPKYDGYRMLARISGKSVKLFTRNGNDWTAKLEKLRAELAAMKLPSGWYDGEIVVHNDHGVPDFGLLQLAFDERSTADIVYFVFDAPYLNGYDIRQVPLFQRRELLRQALEGSSSDMVRFSATLDAPPQEMVVAACQMGLEGIVGKRRDGAYVSRRSPDWIKLKCGHRQEFVIGGYTDPKGSRTGIGSLLLGTYDEEGALQYAGNVGSGFNESTLKDILAKLKKVASDVRPFAKGKAIAGKPHWVKPELVAEVTFGEWTSSGSIRHSVFQGMRSDKKARGITREKPEPAETESESPAAKPASRKKASAQQPAARMPDAGDVGSKIPASLKITNPDRVIDKASGATKIALVRYYTLVGPLMVEHLKDRPVSLVRAPAGVGGELFFQKHADLKHLPGLKAFPQALDPEHPPMLEVPTTEGLLSAAQFNVVEFHTQNAFGKNYEKPNRMVFDLDPGKGVSWEQIQEAATIVKAFLDQLGLASFLKTSGGKGLHLVVPIKPFYGWDEVKSYSQAIVQHIASTIPDRFSAKSGPANREGKIYIDYLRNGRGATTACAWSARTRPGLGISVPVAWEELPGLKGGDHWNVATVHTRLDHGNEPWADYTKSAVSLTQPMKALGYKPQK